MSKLEHWYFERVYWYVAYCSFSACLPHGVGTMGRPEGMIYIAGFFTMIIMMCIWLSEADNGHSNNYDIREGK